MLFLYFSSTGNTGFCIRYLAERLQKDALVYSIEEPEAELAVREQNEIILGYPVYYSNLPKILRDYIVERREIWKGKRVFLLATMGAFSGDGAGVAARLLRRHGAQIMGGLHLKMPDCIIDVKALKKSDEQNRMLVQNAKCKMDRAAKAYQEGKFPKEGLGIWYHLAGLFGQRLYFFHKTQAYSDKLKVDSCKCTACGKCVSLCPMKNLTMENGKVYAHDRCTMCYRCINNCPGQAITLIGKKVVAGAFTDFG